MGVACFLDSVGLVVVEGAVAVADSGVLALLFWRWWLLLEQISASWRIDRRRRFWFRAGVDFVGLDEVDAAGA